MADETPATDENRATGQDRAAHEGQGTGKVNAADDGPALGVPALGGPALDGPAGGSAAGGQGGAGGGSGRVLRGLGALFGALSLVGGLTWLLLNLHGPRPVLDFAVGLVLALGGLLLLMPHRVRVPLGAGGVVAVVAGLGGTAVGLLGRAVQECCMFAFVERRGFPFAWLERGSAAETPELARQAAAAADWHVSVLALGADAVVWAYAGILILVLVRRGR